MIRYIAILCLLPTLAAPGLTCDKPASGEGFSYVIRGAAFLYDFTQDPPMAYGELAIEVTSKSPITQVCIICPNDAQRGKLSYVMMGVAATYAPKRLAAFDVQLGQLQPKHKLMEYIMPLDAVAAKSKFRVFVQAPIKDLTSRTVIDNGRLETTAPSFMVPCDMISVRILPPRGSSFVPDKETPEGLTGTKLYRLRGTPDGAGAMDNAIAHAMYVLGREDTVLPEGGYYIKTLKPQERFPIAGELGSVRAESTRRALMLVGALVAMLTVVLVLSHIAKRNSASRLKTEAAE
jgi:hypothetical protein